ncbi:LADA_0F09824g1_1 [Lachancea dasiensis]|uniref:Elongator complex protein 2 n=1 Tax=Lachancea dasiensis TaxID=1072105 RepID=A0A1G4JLM1_9SACH|nr:LADA_0F09824g1_1 [Lachancea dasiensis]
MVLSEGVFIGCNRQTQVSDYSSKWKVAAFGAGKTIALWKPLESAARGVYVTLKGHKAEVTCVRFVKDSDLMITASEDFQIKIWEHSNDTFENIQTLNHHKHTITAIAVLHDIFAVGCADGSVSIWSLASGKAQLAHSFEPKTNTFPLCLALKSMQDNSMLLAVGGTNPNVFIYSFEWRAQEMSNFQQAAVLEGHEDWIKAMDFYEESKGNILLATGSQDRYIRLWRIRTNELIDNSDEDDSKLKLLSNKQSKFMANANLKVAINFEALIVGHDDWISCLQWHKDRLQLMASTADTAVMIWEPDEDSGVWICASRLGELSSKGASTATGSAGGFWSCNWLFHEGRDYILTNGKTGSWRMWGSGEMGIWHQHLAITGPAKAATDAAWSPDGTYLLVTSLDQTTRLLSKYRRTDDRDEKAGSWFEFARPQIHGYDMMCVEPLSKTRFISGGDEKILRSFDEPKGVAQILEKFAGIHIEHPDVMPDSAALPALGLSSKAVADTEDEEEEDPDARETNETKNISFDVVSSLTTPPIEDQLQRHTLWPEIEKLYGHGYEISCLDISADSNVVASACKSNNTQHAVIRFFDTRTWLQLKPAEQLHALTITRLKFSNDNTSLLSVSRDRQWAIWRRDLTSNEFHLAYKNERAHTRIIWDGDWAPLEYGQLFVTASRDKSVKAWRFSSSVSDYVEDGLFKLGEPVTALSIYPELFNGKILLALGLESGAIEIFIYGEQFCRITRLDDKITPADRINRLRWSPVHDGCKLNLASVSADHSARIYSIDLSFVEELSR